MKKIITFLAFLFMLFVYCSQAKAQTTVKIGQEISSADTVQVEVQLDLVRPPASHHVIYVTVDESNSGTIKFSVDQVINSSFYSWPAGAKFPITIKNGKQNLRYKASASGQKFVITQ